VTTTPRGISKQGHYAGAVSRGVAFAADIGIAWLAFVAILGALSVLITLITGRSVHLNSIRWASIVGVCVWYPIYFAYQWALSGKTLGMALFGLRVVSAEGRPITTRQALARTLTLPISIAFFGLGLFGIVLRVDHRAWHDRIARTCVVYDWDARAARLRWLARQNELPSLRPPVPAED